MVRHKKESTVTDTVIPTPQPDSIIPDPEPVIPEPIPEPIDSVHPDPNTIAEGTIDNLLQTIEGDLIQVEGIVLEHLTGLTIRLETTSSQVDQILAICDYVQDNWNYIHDPVRGEDTWRSASITLSLVKEGRYFGDCDDFAILMASFARQVGLQSRVAAGFYDGYGHAFAEFLLPDDDRVSLSYAVDRDKRKDARGTWVSLDWFKGNDHNVYLKNLRVHEDI